MNQQTWRDRSREVLKEVFARLAPDADLATTKRAVRDAYPFGERAMHPYKIWTDEARRWIDARFPDEARRRNREAMHRELAKRGLTSDPDSMFLVNE